MSYINIHTHQLPQHHELAVLNLYHHFENVEQPGHYSIGLHPWYINDQWQKEFDQLQQFASHTHVNAIGECGLDKVCTTDFSLQQEVFQRHIHLANAIGKPLIIHCVKAYEEVLQQLKQAQVPALFHGFNKSKELALQIINAGHYISFGKALRQPHMQEVLKAVPLTNLFLETDEAAITIASVYQLAAQVFSIDEDSLSLQLLQNASLIFKL